MAEITSYSVIRNGKAWVNGQEVFSSSTSYDEFIKELYRDQKIGYPKFFKMDRLSKLGLVTSELLLSDQKISEEYSPDKIGIYLANNAASLDTDREHQNTIQNRNDYFPSPAIFVYTLPNIVVGEIAIKQKIKGPNNFFIFDKFDASFFASYVTDQMKLNKSETCLFGWVNVDGEEYDSCLFLAEKKKGICPLNTTSIERIYNR
ncbi:MAG: 3-oxoacyl-ACP synthase [Crocinitomicaceae bacterium]|nr:3-oxoacyl-ACP synthase [Crocinitomicaceae bacterium]|tara:strand:+ start:5744 stop:6355 length:612 start_codon:yes stop_codon:yes gene_type:complete